MKRPDPDPADPAHPATSAPSPRRSRAGQTGAPGDLAGGGRVVDVADGACRQGERIRGGLEDADVRNPAGKQLDAAQLLGPAEDGAYIAAQLDPRIDEAPQVGRRRVIPEGGADDAVLERDVGEHHV